MEQLKLDTKRTILVGFAFLSICSFWQMYDNVIPLILTNNFHMNESWAGVIMAADNVLALFLLPYFGSRSDRCRHKLGRRRPYILRGTLLAMALMLLLPLLDNSYFAAPAAWKEWAFIGVLGLLLISMGTYRSPAVALMPDVTPKPLRSKGNAIINLMGAVGGILFLIVSSLLYSSDRVAGKAHVSYLPLFGVVAGVMLLALLIVMRFVDEPKLAARARAYEESHPEQDEAAIMDANGEIAPAVKRSLGFLLASIALWFIGYNGVTTWFTTYASRMWGMTLGDASMCLTVATAGAILTYIPAGALASRFGRKKTILIGVALLTACFGSGFVYTLFFHSFHPALLGMFVLVGVAWAMINVNSLPMVVEMCKGSDVGKFTGYYYTFSMAAQTVTPIVAGTLLNRVSYKTLFPYATFFVAASFVTMLFVKHGDNRLPGKKGLEAFAEMDD